MFGGGGLLFALIKKFTANLFMRYVIHVVPPLFVDRQNIAVSICIGPDQHNYFIRKCKHICMYFGYNNGVQQRATPQNVSHAIGSAQVALTHNAR